MPAQILPMIDEAQNEYQRQQNAFTQRLQQSQLELQQAQFQQEHQLAPLRQQILQNEFQAGQQAVQLAAQTYTQRQYEQERAKTRAPMEDALLGSQVSEAGSRSKQAGIAADEYATDAPTRAKHKQNELDQESLALKLGQQGLTKGGLDIVKSGAGMFYDLMDNIRKSQEHDLAMKLGTSQLDQNAQQLKGARAAATAGVLAIPDVDQRNGTAKIYLDAGMIDNQTYNQIVAAPDLSKDYIGALSKTLGKDKAHEYELMTDRLKQVRVDPTGTVIPDTEAWQSIHALDKMFQDVLDMRSNFQHAPSLPATDHELEPGQVYKNVKNKATGQVKAMRFVDAKTGFVDPNDPNFVPDEESYKARERKKK